MKKPIVIFLISTMLSIPPAMAIDFSKFEATCVEIGFKRNTETFGDCVLELVSRNKKAEVKKVESLAAAKQIEYERQKEREIAALRQQQLAIQQQQAIQRQQEPSFASSLGMVLLGAAIGYNGERHSSPSVQSYQPIQSHDPINCNSYVIGNMVNTNCR